MHHTLPHYFTAAMDIAAAAGILGSIIGFLPPMGAALGVIWYIVLFYDRFLGRGRTKDDSIED